MSTNQQVNVAKLKELDRRSKLFGAATELVVGLLCFFITAAVCWFTGQGQRAAVEQLYDSGHYMETCRQLVLFLHGGASSTTGFDLNKLVEYVMLDGPVLPILAGGVLMVFNQMPGAGDWWLFALVQCALQGAAAVLVAALTYELVGSRRWSLAAGLTWGLYPAAILATRVLMSETLTVVLLLLEVYLLCRILTGTQTARQIACAIGSGIVSCLILLTKPALFASCVLVNLLAVSNLPGARRKVLTILTFALGIGLTLAPWLIFTKTCVGQVYLTPQRQPVFNVAKGCDIEADGVGGFPYTIPCNMFTESDGALNVVASIAVTKPTEFFGLCMRKITRLFSLPWNDYRAKVLGLSAQAQAHLHRALWLIGLLGFLSICAGLKAQSKLGTKVDRQNLFVGEACALIILGHLGYILFEAIPRYGFTAMPFVIVLAMYFVHGVVARKTMWKEVTLLAVSVLMVLVSLEADLIPYLLMLTDDMSNALWLGLIGQWLIIAWTLWLLWRIANRLIGNKSTKLRLAGCLIVFVAIAGVLLFSQKFNRASAREWQSVLSGNMVATREVWLKGESKENPSWALVLVDGDANLATARIEVNGHELSEKLESLYQFYPRKFQLINAMQLQAVSLGIKPDLLRQWRAVPIPVEWLNLEGRNELSVRPSDGSKLTIYGDYPALSGERRYVPSFEVFSHGKLWNSVDSLDGRLVSPIALSDVQSRNSIAVDGPANSRDLSPLKGLQVGDYRLFIALGRSRGDKVRHVVKHGSNHVTNLSVEELVIGPKDVTAAGMKELNLDIPQTVAKRSHIQVDLTGQMMSKGIPMPATAVLIAQTADMKAPIVLPGTPQVMFVGNKWTPLKVSEILPVQAVLGGIGKLSLQMYMSPKDIASGGVVFHNLKLSVVSVDKPTLNDHWMGIY